MGAGWFDDYHPWLLCHLLVLCDGHRTQGLADDREANPGLWTFLIFIPFGVFYSHYKYGELYEKVASDKLNRWILFILWIVFSPAVWFIVQMELNNRATYNGPGQPAYPQQAGDNPVPKEITE